MVGISSHGWMWGIAMILYPNEKSKILAGPAFGSFSGRKYRI